MKVSHTESDGNGNPPQPQERMKVSHTESDGNGNPPQPQERMKVSHTESDGNGNPPQPQERMKVSHTESDGNGNPPQPQERMKISHSRMLPGSAFEGIQMQEDISSLCRVKNSVCATWTSLPLPPFPFPGSFPSAVSFPGVFPFRRFLSRGLPLPPFPFPGSSPSAVSFPGVFPFRRFLSRGLPLPPFPFPGSSPSAVSFPGDITFGLDVWIQNCLCWIVSSRAENVVGVQGQRVDPVTMAFQHSTESALQDKFSCNHCGAMVLSNTTPDPLLAMFRELCLIVREKNEKDTTLDRIWLGYNFASDTSTLALPPIQSIACDGHEIEEVEQEGYIVVSMSPPPPRENQRRVQVPRDVFSRFVWLCKNSGLYRRSTIAHWSRTESSGSPDSTAKVAAQISYKQVSLAMRMGDPLLLSRCYLFCAIALTQQKKFRKAARIVQWQFQYAVSVTELDARLLKMYSSNQGPTLLAKIFHCKRQTQRYFIALPVVGEGKQEKSSMLILRKGIMFGTRLMSITSMAPADALETVGEGPQLKQTKKQDRSAEEKRSQGGNRTLDHPSHWEGALTN
ncbi:unnamed protein product [Cyprideis torosa]|uniref:Uncharacterized protein n=1 Tax=Cyprideis torosa TaxID=163714 RepID=A0A7R8W720_9CRUS|nr:unnamed protein product [Cyprideis torosa]CAG0882841.1 unnamed protein product [Cyprideis torosa]